MITNKLVHASMVAISIMTTILSWIALNGPAYGSMLNNSLLTIKPIDSGPTFWMGVGSSCLRVNTDSKIRCTGYEFNPKYNFSAISDAPIFVLQTPPALLRALVLISTISVTILMLFMGIMVRLFGQNNDYYRKGLPALQYFEAFTCLIGTLSYWVLQLYFEKTSQNFNEIARLLGRSDLHASLGHGFSCAYTGYGFIVFFVIVTTKEREQIKAPSPSPPPPASAPPPPPPPPPLPPPPQQDSGLMGVMSELFKKSPELANKLLQAIIKGN